MHSETWILALFAIIIHGLLSGAFADYVSKARRNGSGFVWGFFLGVIGIMIVGFLPNHYKQSCESSLTENPKLPQSSDTPENIEFSDNLWLCKNCGTLNSISSKACEYCRQKR